MVRDSICRTITTVLLIALSRILAAQNAPVPKCKFDQVAAGVPNQSAQSPYQRTKEILSDAARDFTLSESELCKLEVLDQPIAVLADFLEDKELSFWAMDAMMRIDPPAAAPVLAKKAQERDMDHMSSFYYKLGLVNPMPWRYDLHQVAVRELQAGRTSGDMIYVLGLTGDANDVPLLEQIYSREEEPESRASEAALARLGSSYHLNNIETQLRMTLNPETAERKRYNQAVQASNAIEAAGFSGNQRFVPLLCSHLQDSGAASGDQIFVPSWEAAQALSLIVDHKLLPDVVPQDDLRQWEMRCASFKSSI